VGKLRINYVDVGSGPTVLLLHGIGHNIHAWRQTIPVLASAGYRVMAVDLPGMGWSDFPKKMSRELFVNFVRVWLDIHCIDQAVLMGNSMGGGLAAATASYYPERVAALGLVAPAGFGKDVAWGLRLSGALPIIPRHLTRNQVRKMVRNAYYDKSLVDEEEVDLVHQTLERPGALVKLGELIHAAVDLRGLKRGFSVESLPNQISAPTLLVWGKQDAVCPASHSKRAMEFIPDTEFHLIDNCGHCPQIEQSKVFNGLLLDFLERTCPVGVQVTGRAATAS
jgi:2-hydroxy-6-oxonona-2,4-dienedioate hydrolase